MGLIKHARLVQQQSDCEAVKKKTSLLDRIRRNSSYDCVLEVFRNFLKSAGYERGGILYPSPDGMPVLLFASGFDLTTVFRFSPPIENLVDPEMSGSGWFRLEGHSLEPFSSCFSSRELDSIVTISAHQLCLGTETTALVVLVESLLDINRAKKNLNALAEDFRTLSELLGAHRNLLLSLSRVASVNQSRTALINHTKSAIESGKTATLVRISFAKIIESQDSMPTDPDRIPIYSAILHQISRQIGSANLVHVCTDYSVNLVLFSSSTIDTSFYFHQMLKPLESVFGVQRISRIVVSAEGTSGDIREITDFILGKK